MVGGALGVIAYLAGHSEFSAYLNIPNVLGSGEIVIFAGALVGAGMGFLWFNTYPAQGYGRCWRPGARCPLGVMAVIARHEIILFIMGGVFVVEAFSVIIQFSS